MVPLIRVVSAVAPGFSPACAALQVPILLTHYTSTWPCEYRSWTGREGHQTRRSEAPHPSRPAGTPAPQGRGCIFKTRTLVSLSPKKKKRRGMLKTSAFPPLLLGREKSGGVREATEFRRDCPGARSVRKTENRQTRPDQGLSGRIVGSLLNVPDGSAGLPVAGFDCFVRHLNSLSES